MIWIILLIIHVALVVVAFALAKKAQETQWLLFTGLCLIPLLGPSIVVYTYLLSKAVQNEWGNSDNSKQS